MIDLSRRQPARFAAVCVCVVLLGGCMHAARTISVHHYDLGPVAAAGAATRDASHGDGEVLQLARITVPEWLAGSGMHYRLDYRDDQQLAVYGYSDWIAPPATLLEPIIRNALAAGGHWRAVIGPGSAATADASLHIQLDDFSQTFPQPKTSSGIIAATVTLIDNHDDKVLAQKHFHVEVPAQTPDARGGAAALGQASRKFAKLLRRWLQTAVASPAR